MTALTRQMQNATHKLSDQTVKCRVALVVSVKVLFPLLMIVPSAMISAVDAPGMELLGTIMVLLCILTFAFHGFLVGNKAEAYANKRAREKELEAHRKMRELGLKGRPYPVYFWEIEPRKGWNDPHNDIAVSVRKLTPVEPYRGARRGYLLSPVEGETVQVVEDQDGDGVAELSSARVVTQYLSSGHPEDPELAGMMLPEDEDTLTRVQNWVSQLNQQAKAEYLGERKRLKASQSELPPELNPRERKITQLKTVQQRALKQ